MRKKTSKQNSKMSSKTKTLLKVLLAIGFTGFMICFIIGSYVLHDMVKSVNGESLVDLEFYKQNQDQTTIIYVYDGENNPVELTRLHGEQNRVWVDIDDMSEWIGKAFVALEDKRFYEHHGVDWVRTVLGVIKNKFKQGGSTITQQLIKNLTGENDRTISRKYYEIISALNLEKNYNDKEVILEAYLNTIYLSHGCYGVQTAAEKYFGKDISELNLAECASLAVIAKDPAKYDPLWQPKNNKERQEMVLDYMLEQDMINQKQHDEAVAYELIFTNSEKYVADEEDDTVTAEENEIQSYYTDYVISSVIRDLKEQGYSNYEATKMIYSGGLRIYSSVDIRIQEIAEDVYTHRTNFPSQRVDSTDDLYQSAMTIMDYKGRIVAMVGGAGEKTQNRTNNRAVSAVRQPGSSIKPLSVYAPAIEEDYATWSTLVQNYGIIWRGNRWPENYGGSLGSPDSYVTVQYAIAISYNTVAAQLLMKLGFETSYDYLTNKFHITTLVDGEDNTKPSAMATGGTHGGVTTLQMAAAFAAFGNGGKYYKPYCYDYVTDSTGENIILQNVPQDGEPQSEQIISPETAYVMNEMMRTVFVGAGGTGRGYGVSGFTTFGKTGTSSDNHDRWCVAGTPYYVAAVWFGHDYNKEVKVSGNPAGLIFKTVMDRVHKNLAPKSFERNTDQAVQRTYCTATGLLAGDGCYSKASGWYKASNLPATCTKCGGAPAGPAEEETTQASGDNAPQPPVTTTQPQEATTKAETPSVTEPATSSVTEPAVGDDE